MKTLILMLVCVSGCAALTRLNTFRYDGVGDRPVLVERSAGTIWAVSPGNPGSWDSHIQKVVTVQNPLNREVQVTVSCSAITQGDLEFSLPPHSSQMANVETSRRNEYVDTCQILDWEVK